MPELEYEVCPETGICSIMKCDKTKIDLMPDEVEAIRDAGGDAERIKAILAESDRNFTVDLAQADLVAIGKRLG